MLINNYFYLLIVNSPKGENTAWTCKRSGEGRLHFYTTLRQDASTQYKNKQNKKDEQLVHPLDLLILITIKLCFYFVLLIAFMSVIS